jgi:hypothetical protein
MPRPLKVYRAHLGFFDTVVAAHSQKEALAAWGAGASELHQGFATVTNDKDAVVAALRYPGIVLYRPFGSGQAFSAERTLPGVKSAVRKAEKESEQVKRAQEKRNAETRARQNRAEQRRDEHARQKRAREERAEQKRAAENRAREERALRKRSAAEWAASKKAARIAAKKELDERLREIKEQERKLANERAAAQAAYAAALRKT